LWSKDAGGGGMTLDEAIKHAEEVMVENLEKSKCRNASDTIAIKCGECAEEHRQLAEWLKELKQLREQTRWIPVSSGKLPEIHQDVLLSLRNLDVEVGFRGETEPYYYCNGYYVEPKNILAWQHKPEPYDPESEK
jgi:hypothetical protein